MVIKMFTEPGRRVYEHSGKFNKETENIRKYQIEVIIVLKNTLKVFKYRLDEVKNDSVSWKTKHWNSPRQQKSEKRIK